MYLWILKYSQMQGSFKPTTQKWENRAAFPIFVVRIKKKKKNKFKKTILFFCKFLFWECFNPILLYQTLTTLRMLRGLPALPVLIMHRCFQLASTDFQSTLLRRPSHQHVVLWWTAFGLHSHHPHRVPMSLCCPRAVQVYQAHTLFTWSGPNRKKDFILNTITQESDIFWHLILLVYTYR